TQQLTCDLWLCGGTECIFSFSWVYRHSLQDGDWNSVTCRSLPGLADGSYQFRAVVTDNAGNSSNTAAISVIVDNTAPTAGTLSLDRKSVVECIGAASTMVLEGVCRENHDIH